MERGNGNTVLLTVIGVATLLVALVGATFAYFTANATSNSSQSLSISTAAPVQLITEDVGTAIALNNAIPGATSTSGQQGFTVENPSTSTVKQTYDLSLVIDSDTFNTNCTVGKATADIKDSSNNTVLANDATYACTGDGRAYADQIAALFADQLELTIVQTTAVTPAAGASQLKLGDVNVEAMSRDTNTHTVVYNLTDGATHNGQTYVLVNDQLIAPGEKHQYAMTLNFKEINLNQNANAATVDNSTTPATITGAGFTGHLVMNDVKAVSNN